MNVFNIYTLYINDNELEYVSSFGFDNMDFSNTTYTFSSQFFNEPTEFQLVFNGFNNKNIENIDDVESLTFTYIHTKSTEINEKKKLKDQTCYLIKKREDEVEALKKERKELNKKIEIDDQSDDEIKSIYKDIEFINDQIRLHNKEIKRIKENVKMIDLEVCDKVEKYVITVFRNQLQFISGLPGQKINFSIILIVHKDFENKTEPIEKNEINNKKFHISYDDLMSELEKIE